MSGACHVCGSELVKLGGGFCCRTCGRHTCAGCERKEDPRSLVVDGGNSSRICKTCAGSGRGYLKSSPAHTPSISPAMSLTSFDSCASSCGETLTDTHFSRRVDSSEGVQDSCVSAYNAAGTIQDSHNPDAKDIEIQGADSAENLHVLAEMSMENGKEKNAGDSTGEKNKFDTTGTAKTGGELEVKTESSVPFQKSEIGHQSFYVETDPIIWIPPEPEDEEDEIDCSVAYDDDDDDECSDGVKWVSSNFLSYANEEIGSNHKVKEAQSQAIVKVVREHFLATIAELLDSENIDKNWVETVSSLSWEAASLIKPSANEDVWMDPTRYLKVKCIASGLPGESQVIKGLVFKKNAAHKHMVTRYKSPRLLLLRGVLGERDGLASFKAMGQENDYLKSIHELLEVCHPNIVLVEKTVTRDVQESLLAKGITLVFDMKLSRLEKLSRCTGSKILSFDSDLPDPKLKQCDSFHVEKFREEHNSSEGGAKRSTKTLMFFEGCPKPLGCTILLKGAPSDELKKVKALFQQAVSIAYHFILESSLLLDQRAIVCKNYPSRLDKEMPSVSSNLDISSGEEVKGSKASNETTDILIEDSNEEMPLEISDQMPPPVFYSEQIISAMSASIKKVWVSSFISSYLGYIGSGMHESGHDFTSPSPQITSGKMEESASAEEKKWPSDEAKYDEMVNSVRISEEESDEDFCSSEKMVASDFYEEPSRNEGVTLDGKCEILEDDSFWHILGPKSILVLHSSRCIWKGSICKQNTLSRMKYYSYFDMSLGKILSSLMLNQKYNCPTCMEPPEGHEYSYTHTNGRIIVRVKRLPPDLRLPGETEGKLWMWFVCLRCKETDGVHTPTRRTVMSSTTHAFSFGKYLELSFSKNLPFNRSLSCGHCLHRECLQFFGLGNKIVMFQYSDVEIYAACSPPLSVEFTSACDQEWLSKEAQDVLAKGHLLFTEVMNQLHNIGSGHSSFLKRPFNLGGSIKNLDDIEEMLRLEKSEFETSLQRAASRKGQLGHVVQHVLSLNRLNHELLLQLYVWDRRIHYILSLARDDIRHDEEKQMGDDSSVRGGEGGQNPYSHGKVLEDSSDFTSIVIESSSVAHDSDYNKSISNLETDLARALDQNFASTLEISDPLKDRSSDDGPCDKSLVGRTPLLSPLLLNNGVYRDDSLQDQHFITFSSAGGSLRSVSLDANIESKERKLEIFDKVVSKSLSENSLIQKFLNHEGWVWRSFSETREAYRKDLKRGYSQKFEFINSYTPVHLSLVNQYITQEKSRLHFPIGSEDDFVSVYEDEFTSIIACALALSFDNVSLVEKIDGLETSKVNGRTDFTYEAPSSLSSKFDGKSVSSLMDVETSYLEKDGASGGSFTFGANEVSKDGSLHPEISLGIEVSPGKSKYSVVCIHAKLFYALRKRCCPSELDYISSLSRCKHWNAQGGKSKSFFAKTLDDRFIVKQIKKTEFDSFVKFAPDYYNHIMDSFTTGSQTCLAKILGVYQVTMRQNKNGRELKISLIVMENLVFGRKISRLYDLKGALHLRLNTDPDVSGKVLLDQNFVNDMWDSPVYVSGKTKQELLRAVWNDTSFLTGKNVMDYSLLVGVDEQRRELVFGIIDYLREYTWDKHLETWVKASLVVPKNAQPTVISPREYKKRFRKFMSNFLTIPDWSYEQHFAVHKYIKCKLDCSSIDNRSEMEETD